MVVHTEMLFIPFMIPGLAAILAHRRSDHFDPAANSPSMNSRSGVAASHEAGKMPTFPVRVFSCRLARPTQGNGVADAIVGQVSRVSAIKVHDPYIVQTIQRAKWPGIGQEGN